MHWRDSDVFVSKEKGKARKTRGNGAVAVAKPQTVLLPMADRKGAPFIKIIDEQNRRVVAAFELLSPSNKAAGPKRTAYLEKREEYFASGVNLVEINLFRAGRLPPLEGIDFEDLQYYILVCKARELPRATIWTFSMREPFPDFPDVPAPLRGSDQVVFNLRPCMDRAFEEGRYERDIDYSGPPSPPLPSEDDAWARDWLKKREVESRAKTRGESK